MLKLITLFCVICEIFAAPFSINEPSNLATYTDAFARNDMLALASAAYSTNPQKCLTKRFTSATLKRQVNVPKCAALKDDVCSGYTAVLHADKAIVISFRGTQGFLQLISEANKSIFETQMAWVAGGKVSKYFGDAFTKLWNAGIKDDFAALLAQNPGYEVWVVGHSLGGSLASLAASYIIGTKQVAGTRVKLITYGEPRTGNKDYAHAHDGQLAYSFRVTHNRDVVPHIPNEDVLGYYHNKFEVFYRQNMNAGAKFTVCSEDEDKNCSDGLDITVSIPDHLHYFDKDISEWGDKGCA